MQVKFRDTDGVKRVKRELKSSGKPLQYDL